MFLSSEVDLNINLLQGQMKSSQIPSVRMSVALLELVFLTCLGGSHNNTEDMFLMQLY